MNPAKYITESERLAGDPSFSVKSRVHRYLQIRNIQVCRALVARRTFTAPTMHSNILVGEPVRVLI